MLQVKVFKVRKQIGTISLGADGKLIFDPEDDNVLRLIASTPIGVPDEIEPKDGEKFLTNLHREYKSAYCMVSEAVDVKEPEGSAEESSKA